MTDGLIEVTWNEYVTFKGYIPKEAAISLMATHSNDAAAHVLLTNLVDSQIDESMGIHNIEMHWSD